jgi:hypothetical protein
MSAAEHFSPRHTTSAVPGPYGWAAPSSSTVPGSHGWAASSSSAVPGPHGWAASSTSAGTGRRIPVQDLASSAVPGHRISVLDTASSTVSGPGRRISVRSSFFSSTRMMHTRPSGVGCPPGPWTATGRRTVFQTLTPQPGTVFPGTPARFFARAGWSRWRLTRIMARIYMYSNLRRRGKEILQMVLEKCAKGRAVLPSVFH